MDSKPLTSKEQKAAGRAMSLMLDQLVTHVRVDALDASGIYVHGTAYELHGELGSCVCCHGGNPKRALEAIGRGQA